MLPLLDVANLCDGAFAIRVRVIAKVLHGQEVPEGLSYEAATPRQRLLMLAASGGDISDLIFRVASNEALDGQSVDRQDWDVQIGDAELFTLTSSFLRPVQAT